MKTLLIFLMKIQSSKKFIASQIASNLLAIIALLTCVMLVSPLTLGNMLIALAIVNFFQGFIGTFISEVFTRRYLNESNVMLYEYIETTFLSAILFFLIIIFFYSIGGSFLSYKYLLLIGISLVFGAPYLINKADMLLGGELEKLTIINVLDCTIYFYILFSVIYFPNILLTYDMLLIRITLLAIIQLVISNKNIKYFANYQRIKFYKRFKDIGLASNLFLKSGVGNLDIILIANVTGKEFTPIYKLLQSMKTLLMSFSGSYWKSKISSVIDGNLIDTVKLKIVISKLSLISIVFALLGSLCIIYGINYIYTNDSVNNIFETKFWLYQKEILFFLFLIALPHAISQWTRVMILLSTSIMYSTICYIFLAVSLIFATLFSKDFTSFILTYGLGTFVTVIFYNSFIYRKIAKQF